MAVRSGFVVLAARGLSPVCLAVLLALPIACGSDAQSNTQGSAGGGGVPGYAGGAGSPSAGGVSGPILGSGGGGAGLGGTVGTGGVSSSVGAGGFPVPGSGGASAVGGVMGTGGNPTTGGGAGQAGAGGATTCTKQITPSQDCTAPLAPGDSKSCTVGGRQYYVYAPENFDVCKPAALILDAHGATQTAESQLLGKPAFCVGTTCWDGPGSGWRLEAEAPGGGFILVTPSSATTANTWDATTDPPVMMQIIDAVKKVADIDPKKIYMSGISNGAALSYWTACANPGVFAGIAPNSGGVLGGAQCNSLSSPQSDIQFDDQPDFAFNDSQSTVTNMAATDHCKEGPKDWKTIDSTTTDPICLLDPDNNATTLVPCNSQGGIAACGALCHAEALQNFSPNASVRPIWLPPTAAA